jgi:hypothetical protein
MTKFKVGDDVIYLGVNTKVVKVHVLYTLRGGSVAVEDSLDPLAPTGAGGNTGAFVCCEGIGRHESGCTPDQPAARLCACPSSACAETDGGIWPGEKCRRTADQQAVSMQEAVQPTEGTGKQSMQACTTEKQTLVQLTGRQADGLINATKALLDSVCPKCHGTGKEVAAETSWDGMTPYHYVTFCSACDGGRTADKSSDTPARGLHFDED